MSKCSSVMLVSRDAFVSCPKFIPGVYNVLRARSIEDQYEVLAPSDVKYGCVVSMNVLKEEPR